MGGSWRVGRVGMMGGINQKTLYVVSVYKHRDVKQHHFGSTVKKTQNNNANGGIVLRLRTLSFRAAN